MTRAWTLPAVATAMMLSLGCGDDAPQTQPNSAQAASGGPGGATSGQGGAATTGTGARGDLGDRFALDFPSNVTGDDQAAPLVALQYADPQRDGLPFAGPEGRGVTYLWRVNQRAQTGYYVTLWWSQGDGGFTPSAQYVGGHPYPKVANNTGTTHRWEIAAPSGGDYFDTRAGAATSKDVVYDVWRTQAVRVVRNADTSKTYTSTGPTQQTGRRSRAYLEPSFRSGLRHLESS
jgi:hypothetical protein